MDDDAVHKSDIQKHLMVKNNIKENNVRVNQNCFCQVINILSASNHTKYVSLSNQKYMTTYSC